MIRKIFFLIFLIFFSTSVQASSKIAFININLILEESSPGIQITEILKKKRDKETKKLEAKKKDIKKKEIKKPKNLRQKKIKLKRKKMNSKIKVIF